MSGLTNTGVVEDRPHDHPERGGPIKTSDDVRASLQRHGGHPVRAHDLPRHRHLLPSGRPRASERPQLDSVRAHERADQSVKAFVRAHARGVSRARDGVA